MRHFDSETLLEPLVDSKLQVDCARGLIHVIERRLACLAAQAAHDGRHDEAAEYADDATILRYTRLSR